MGNFKEFQGKDLEDTLQRAATELDRPQDQIDYEVVSEGRKGWFLGVGSQEYRIRVRLSKPPSYESPPEDGFQEMVEGFVADFLKGLQLDLDFKVWNEDDRLRVNLFGPDRDYLVDSEGEVLSAIQFLLSRMTRRRFQDSVRIHVDSEGFRIRREEEIVQMARGVADRVRRDREGERLPPLNPYERRLVHIAIRDIPGVSTRSLGEGFLKRISIHPVREGVSSRQNSRDYERGSHGRRS